MRFLSSHVKKMLAPDYLPTLFICTHIFCSVMLGTAMREIFIISSKKIGLCWTEFLLIIKGKVVVSLCPATSTKKRRELGFSVKIIFFRNFDVAVPTSGSQGASRRPLTAGGRHFRSLSEGLLNNALKSTWVLYYKHPTFHVLRISEMGNILLK